MNAIARFPVDDRMRTLPPVGGPASLLDCIGNTPLLRLGRIGGEFENVEFYAKAEWFNPGGSVKDRAALSIIREAESSGDLHPGKTILDATSGNTGIAYAMIGAALGYSVTLCLPESASAERKRILQRMKVPTEPSGAFRLFTRRTRSATFMPTSTVIPRIGARTLKPPAWKSGGKLAAASPISARAWEQPAHLPASREN
jgi:hypothetical protein